jgi:hypothetical protein
LREIDGEKWMERGGLREMDGEKWVKRGRWR